MERRHSIIVCEQLPLARINERSSRSFQTEPFWYRFAAEITWRVNFSPNAQTRTHLIDSSGHLRENRQVNSLRFAITHAESLASLRQADSH
jgi:hypothetical protein